MILIELVYNLSLLIALSIVSGFFDRRYPRTNLTGLIIQGLLFGIVALVGMIHPMNIGAGLIFDGRSIVISLSTLFFGPISGSIAGIIVIITGIIQGGSGIVSGTLVVIFSVIVGTVFHFQKKKRNDEITIRLLVYLGFTINIAMLLMMFTLPFPIAISVIQRIGIPVIICYPLATVLIGKILSDQEINFRIIENIKASELKFRTVSNYTYDWDYWKNEDQKLVYISPSCERITGYTQNEFYSSPKLLEEIVHPDDSEIFIKHSKKVYSYEHKDDFDKLEFRIVKKDGTIVNIYHLYGPIFDSNNKFLGRRANNIDITERKKAEEALNFSEIKHRSFFENSMDAMLITSPDGKILSANPAACRMFGYTEEEFNKLGRKGVMDITDSRLPLLISERALNGKAFGELTFIRKDGTSFLTETSSAIYKTDEGLEHNSMIIRDITERKRTEEELKESEKKLRSLFENSIMGISTATPDGHLILANPAYIQMYGYENLDEMKAAVSNIGSKLYADPEDRKKVLKKLAEKGFFEPTEIEVVKRNGSRFFVLVSAQVIRDTEGKTIYFQANHIDISKRKLVEEELRFKNVILTTQQEASIEGILVVDENGIIVSYNNRLIELWNIPQELIEKKSDELILKFAATEVKDPQPFLIRIQYLNEHKMETSLDEIILNNGLIFERYSAPMYGPEKRYYGRAWYFRDITESRQAEEEVRESEERFRMVFENVFDGISIYSEDPDPSKRRLIECNQQYSNMAGRSRDGLLQIGNTIGLQKTLTDNANDSRLESLNMGKAYQGFFSWIRPDGKENIIEYVGMPITWRGKSYTIGIDRDITERKRIEKELVEAKERAEESDKLKTEFLAQMSHEIRTPLNAIIGNADYLNDYFSNKMNQESSDCFDSIRLASKRIIRTVDLILNAAELQSSGYKPHFVKVDLNLEILSKLFHEHQLSAKQKGLEFIYTCIENDTNVIADEYCITQIFANLIDNAIKYTKKGKVEILLEKNKTGNITVEVKDTGIGISKEFLPRIFGPFTQEEQGYTRTFEGNGLGLALVKRYCELNNIIIEVDSEKNEGSTFRIIFTSLQP